MKQALGLRACSGDVQEGLGLALYHFRYNSYSALVSESEPGTD